MKLRYFLLILVIFLPPNMPCRSQNRYGHLIETKKQVPSSWLESYRVKGPQKIYTGEELKTIGMPCGGIAAGQLYVRGDGTLACWWIANNAYNTGYGIDHFMDFNTALGPWKVCYQTYEPFSYIKQGFDIVINDGTTVTRKHLNRNDYDHIGFIGEYPVAEIRYRDRKDPLPVEVDLEVFSPFVPLNSKESALPATILRFTLCNLSEKTVTAELQGYLQNMVMLDLKNYVKGQHRNRFVRTPGVSSLYLDFVGGDKKTEGNFQPFIFEDFEDGDMAGWTMTGNAFGNKAADITGGPEFEGLKYIHSGAFNREGTGRLVSEGFTVEKDYISFLVSGYTRLDRVNVNLLIDGEMVRQTSGDGGNEVKLVNWDVREFHGRTAQIVINDLSSSPSHFIAVDRILFSDFPVYIGKDLEHHAFNGNVALSLIGDYGRVIPNLNGRSNTLPLGDTLTGGVNCSVDLRPGEIRKVTYVLSWYFPNRPARLDGNNWTKPIYFKGEKIGNMYANWFSSSIDVARYVNEHFDRLKDETYRFRHAYYHETSIPYWLAQRIMMPVSTLATETCQWWATGKFYAWEGVGSCVGTCTHVWNYEQALSRLFPELEMNIREQTDFSTSFREDGGIFTRNGGGNVHLDGQSGTILKSYREYLMSDNILFLSRNWEKIKKATEYLIEHDGNGDGLIEGQQRNTYDISFMGANSYVGGLYLAALRAAEKMALIMDDPEFAKKCRKIYESGSLLSSEKIWNGEYFFQDVDLEKYPRNQYANGCLSDQLFGQTWAHQLGLGYIYPKEQVKIALGSIWKYNWTMDVGKHNELYVPERYFAHAGEPGLVNCTWPLSEHLRENAVRYRNEVWTGIEYQVATNMIYDGMVEEGLTMVRAIHERYSPEKHNPWNEIECGDHYARAMASWGVLIALEDYFYDGNRGLMAWNPKIQKNDFNGFFTSARGWGNIIQQRSKQGQRNAIDVKWGELSLKQLEFGLEFEPAGISLMVNDVPQKCSFSYEDGHVVLEFDEVTLLEKQNLVVLIR